MKRGILSTREQLPDKVVSMLFAEIESGRMVPGEKLPTEQQLADRFGVSRNVLREAVAKLRADGVVETRQGIGTFILEPEKRQVVRIDAATLQDGENMERLFELRCVLETEAASLAAVRGGDADLARIKAAVDRMGGEERWEEGSIDADLEFHREIARATGNGFFFTFITFIGERIRGSIEYARLTNPLHDLVAINVPEHVAIYDALVARDPAASGVAMRRHIMGAAERVGVILPGQAWAQPPLGTLLRKENP
ncbi:MAG: FadR family transcriptional regulator [Rhizobium sp.]|nr:FadR family transcriptional regulator [Rhizobium sp.]